jgi:hypothetical protein
MKERANDVNDHKQCSSAKEMKGSFQMTNVVKPCCLNALYALLSNVVLFQIFDAPLLSGARERSFHLKIALLYSDTQLIGDGPALPPALCTGPGPGISVTSRGWLNTPSSSIQGEQKKWSVGKCIRSECFKGGVISHLTDLEPLGVPFWHVYPQFNQTS